MLAVTAPEAGADGISAFVVQQGDAGFSVGAPARKLGITGSQTCELHFDNCEIPADQIIGAAGSGLSTALRALGHTQVTIAAQAVGIGQGTLDYATS